MCRLYVCWWRDASKTYAEMATALFKSSAGPSSSDEYSPVYPSNSSAISNSKTATGQIYDPQFIIELFTSVSSSSDVTTNM